MTRKLIDAEEFTLPGRAAKEIGVARQTLDSAMRRGDEPLIVKPLWCGGLLVSIESARKWAKSDRKRGPKPKNKQ